MSTTLIRNGFVPGPIGPVRMDILRKDGVITRMAETIEEKTDAVIDASDQLILPGLIDCHVHFREPGLTHKASMKTEAASAKAGGVLTVCEMPNTNPPTVTIAALADKVRRSENVGIDMRFFFGVTQEEHVHALREVWTGEAEELQRLRKRCSGAKAYLDHSTGNQKIDGDVMTSLFRACGELGIPLVAHCEDPLLNAAAAERLRTERMQGDVSLHSLMRPVASEVKAIHTAVDLARQYGTHLHVAHLSSKEGLDEVREAKAEGLSVTCEVAPHHLFLTTDDYDELGTLAKMNPPLRTPENQQALWDGIADGTVDCIATDHAPHTLEEKQIAHPLEAPSGIPGVETMLPLLLTVAQGGWPHPKSDRPEVFLSYIDILRLCFTNPNAIFHLGKMGMQEGSTDSLLLIAAEQKWMIQGEELHSQCGWTPFERWNVQGKVSQVL